MKILTFFANGVEELEAMGTITLLKRAKCEVDVYSFDNNAIGKHKVTFSNLKNINELDNLEQYDALFIPGGPHYKEIEKSEIIINTINYFNSNNKIIACICAAPTILGRMGLLKNKNYTCFTSMNDDFGGNYTDEYVTVDNNLITAKSAAASIELGLTLIKALFDDEMVKKIKDEIYY